MTKPAPAVGIYADKMARLSLVTADNINGALNMALSLSETPAGMTRADVTAACLIVASGGLRNLAGRKDLAERMAEVIAGESPGTGAPGPESTPPPTDPGSD